MIFPISEKISLIFKQTALLGTGFQSVTLFNNEFICHINTIEKLYSPTQPADVYIKILFIQYFSARIILHIHLFITTICALGIFNYLVGIRNNICFQSSSEH
ncbi:unnamed protein product [Rhizophagus irregularis]|uniref:Uncharacterized protein n=1 Tax=Rhizophagus irregularis TaxID=588596 RepID=A0A915ZZJ1_9GLOM|nr:unnamed protein product [Rhizophagus irregularis]